jgi:hypothetical protein
VRRVLLILCSGAFVAGCGDGDPGDLSLVPHEGSSILGDGSRLYQINDPESPQRAANKSDVTVTATTVVVVDTFDETGDGSSAGNLYIEDLPVDGKQPAFGGVTLFNTSFNPPTLRVGPGDVIDIRGSYEEFAGPSSFPFDPGETLPEIVSGTATLRFEYKVPEPVTVDIKDLTTYETGRKWIGMLIRLENVTAQADGFKSTSGRWSTKLDVPGFTNTKKLPTITNALFEAESSGIEFKTGTLYKSVVGVCQFFFNFSVSPRSAEDITP